MTESIAAASGQCLCGAVKFTAYDVEPHYHACHCGTCRRWGGSPAMAVQCAKVEYQVEDGLSWYQSSEWAERGYCRDCGSSLWKKSRWLAAAFSQANDPLLPRLAVQPSNCAQTTGAQWP